MFVLVEFAAVALINVSFKVLAHQILDGPGGLTHQPSGMCPLFFPCDAVFVQPVVLVGCKEA